MNAKLRELSDLLDVEIDDVEHVTLHLHGRHQDHANAWRLCMPSARFGRDPSTPGGLWTWPVKTRTLRRVNELSRLAQVWGRPQDAPPFGSGDPRRVLRLLHEAAEAAEMETTS